MLRFFALIENESLKILRRRRFTIVVVILVAIVSIVAYSRYRSMARAVGRDWRVETQQRVTSYENTLRRGRINPTWARSLRSEVARLQFYLDHDINPEKLTVPLFVRAFANAAGFLLLPLLVAVLGSDIVSAESAQGTEKLLLTRPVRRWKVLASKLGALYLFTTLTLLAGGLLAWGISAVVLDPRGWTAPMFNGFRLSGNGVDLDAVRQLPLWKDVLIAYGLDWYAMLCVASIALMLSVIFRTASASIGTMLASLVGGTIITRLSPDWTAAKYFFVAGLPLADYYSGEPPPYDGMSLLFCVILLGGWALISLVVAFTLFTRRDIFG